MMKKLLTGVLLAFVAVSVVVLIVKETGRNAAVEAAAAAAEPAAAKASERDSAVVVYYLHSSIRCTTCRKLEAYTAEAVTQGFAEPLASGEMIFRSLNLDEPANAHLTQHYNLFTKSVIVSEQRGEDEVRWKNLDRIWDLVGDKAAYLEYVQSEVEAFRGAS